MFKQLFEKAFITSFYKDRENRSTEHNHPSEMTGCARHFWYKINDTPISDMPSIAMQLIWKQGHALQGVLEDLLPLIPEIEDYAIEKPVGDKDYNLGGHADLVVKVDGKWYVLDYKTAGATKFKEVKKKGIPLAYKWQVNQYMHMLRKKHPRKYATLDTAIILFINKSPIPDEIWIDQGKKRFITSPFYELEVEYDEDLLETEIFPQAEYLEDVREMDTPPGRIEDTENCKFCEFRTLCSKDKR
jgi:CRISPR/Cas system-associated exonuclease Cas4 (RecB family)